MNNNKRKKVIIAIAILVILGVLFLVWRLSREPQTGPGQQPTETPPVFKAPSSDLVYQPGTPSPVSEIELSILNLAKSYASRFGSWSTDNQGHNLEELLPLSSATMQTYLKSVPRTEAESFSGITTKSIAAEILSLQDDLAEVLVSTQRIAIGADLRQNVYYQDIKLSLVQGAKGWLVDGAQWQEKK